MAAVELATMATKKTPPASKSGGKEALKGQAKKDERVAVIVLKGSPEYREWLTSISKDTLIPVASIVRDAVGKWALLRGYTAPPEV